MWGLPETLNKPLPETLENGENMKQPFDMRRRSTFISICRLPIEIPLDFGNTQTNGNPSRGDIELKTHL